MKVRRIDDKVQEFYVYMCVCMYVCIMYEEEEGRICDDLGGTAGNFFLFLFWGGGCFSMRYVSVM